MWRQGEEKTVCWDLPDGRLVRVHSCQASDEPRLADWLLEEWTEIVVEVPAGARVSFGGQETQPLTDTVHRYTYCNQVGRSTVRVTLPDGHALPPLDVVLLSPKYPTATQCLRFFEALLSDLVVHSVQLPFTIIAPTGWAIEESPRPPTPLFVYHFLRACADELRWAVETVLGAPHRALTEEEAIVPLPRVAEVDAEVVEWVLIHPESWQRAQHLAVAGRLRGYAPAQVWQRQRTETFDTPPNRFVKRFLRELEGYLDELLSRIDRKDEGWGDVPAGARGELGELWGALVGARLGPLFDEVGELTRFPYASQVLLKRDGYRELLDLWRRFQCARVPLFAPLAEAIAARDVATLYEVWCFFALATELGNLVGVEPRWDLAFSDEHGLEWKNEMHFGPLGWLVYNEGFGWPRSYSVSLQPDFTWHGPGGLIVFDAKFRFDREDVDKLGEGEADDWEQAVVSGDAQRIAKRADLYKMHTYRDALRARAAVALYPGDEDAFYRTDGQKLSAVDWRALLNGELEGIGAVAMAPAS
jgi:predicted component of viral defense system (DUF524 family)